MMQYNGFWISGTATTIGHLAVRFCSNAQTDR